MANSDHLAVLECGANVWNRWRENNPSTVPDLSAAILDRWTLCNVNLSGADLSGADLSEANLRSANLSGANISRKNFSRANLDNANLSKANLSNANLSEVMLYRAILRKADLSGADLTGASLDEADLSNANLSGAKFINARLRDSNLSQANLSGADISMACLEGAILREANLSKAAIEWARLSHADLSRADLSSANLIGAILSEAKLNAAQLDNTNLEKADLSGADLSEAKLIGTNLTAATFFATILNRSIFGWTKLLAVDLSSTVGLESAEHQGPSNIGVDTIYQSKSGIPESFLRGVGVPDDMITYMRSLVGKPFDYYSCFISHSTNDGSLAARLYEDLQANGIRCWYAPHDIKGGKKVHEQIDDAIKVYDKLLLLLSRESMQSTWVQTEVFKARKREIREGRRIMFPVGLVPFDMIREWELFDGDSGRDLAREIREYFIPDFTRWKEHDHYELALQRLLRDLKSENVQISPKSHT